MVEAISRLLVTRAVSYPSIDVVMTKRDIDSAFRLRRLRLALSLLMCAELPGGYPVYSHDLVLIYLAMPIGRNGAPANFLLFGDSIACIHGKFGPGRLDRFLTLPFRSKLYAGNGLILETRNIARQNGSVSLRGKLTLGLLGPQATKQSKIAAEGQWIATHTMLGFNIDAHSLSTSLPGATIAGARFVFD